MAKIEENKNKSSVKEEKVMTKYDLKIQKRKEQEEKERKKDRRNLIIGVVVAIALVSFIASFPIRNYVITNQTYITVSGEKVNKVEFDYNYNTVKNNFINQNSMFISANLIQLDPTGDLSTQMYSEHLSWKDYFEQGAVESIKTNKALSNKAKEAGFTYDAANEYKTYASNMKALASEQSVSLGAYVKASFGSYATMNNLKPYVKEGFELNAFYQKVGEEKAPALEEIQAYYDENKASYDSVDYRVIEVVAELPTEPTELADPVTEEEAYQPSEAEIEAAMEIAKDKADTEESNVAKTGDLKENIKQASATTAISTWLFDDARKAGDTSVIEDKQNNKYYVVAFEKRYLDETLSNDLRIIATTEASGNTGTAILDEWKNGAATEESFAELCKKYSEDTTTKEDGGLYEAIFKAGMDENMSEWLYTEGRAEGDTTVISTEEGNQFVIYYIGVNSPEWQLSIKNTLLSNIMSDYLVEIAEGLEIEDSKGNLNYLKIQEVQEAETTPESVAG